MRPVPRWFEAVLRVLPRPFRERHRAGILEVLGDYRAGRPGLAARLGFWARVTVDTVLVGCQLRARDAFGDRRGERGPGHRRSWLAAVGHDARQGIKSLRRDPGLALTATLIAGFGVGACATVFSVAHALLIRPLPFADAERLVWISNGDWGRGQALSALSVQAGYVQHARAESQTLDDVAGYHLFDWAGDQIIDDDVGGRAPERLTRLRVTENFWSVLGIEPLLGRTFLPNEVEDGGPRAVMLTHGLWTRRYGSDPDVLGRTVTFNGESASVIGILPPSFDFPALFAPGTRTDYVAPFPLNARTDRSGNTLALIGRLNPGSSLTAAEAELTAIAARHPEQRNGFEPRLRPLRDHISGSFRPAMAVLVGSVALVMLIVCATLSNLLLARGQTRHRELALRAALGADRRRLIGQMLTESLILVAGGAALAVLLAVAGTRALAQLDAEIPLLSTARVDGAVLAFTVAIAAATGLLFGLAPALRMSVFNLHDALKAEGRSASAGRGDGALRRSLVVSEIVLACVLLVGSGLLLRSFVELVRTDLGYEPESVVTLRIDPGHRFESLEEKVAYHDDIVTRIRETPGVVAVGLTDVLPVAFNRRWCVRDPLVPARDEGSCQDAYVRLVTEGYMDAMGVRVLEGRGFSEQDNVDTRPVVIVNDVLARLMWGDGTAIGQRLMIYPQEREVVGVTQGMRHLDPDQEPGPEFFIPMRQLGDNRATHAMIRGRGPVEDIRAALGTSIGRSYPDLPIQELRSVEGIVARAISPRRFTLLLVAGFAGFALILASLGIYGVISYSVARRRREIGVRIALGASGSAVRRSVLGETMVLAAVGVAIGILASWILTRFLASQLYGVGTADPLTLMVVPLVLSTVAAVAGYLPARRASRVDPVEALGAEG